MLDPGSSAEQLENVFLEDIITLSVELFELDSVWKIYLGTVLKTNLLSIFYVIKKT